MLGAHGKCPLRRQTSPATFIAMSAPLPLARMTVNEKLQMLDQIWANLLEHEDRVPSPAWHGEILAERDRLVASGEAQFHDLAETMKRIVARLK